MSGSEFLSVTPFQFMHKKVLQFLHSLISFSSEYSFEWDEQKDLENQKKHGVSFESAQEAFLDPNSLIYKDLNHSTLNETRYFCLEKVKNVVCTVRFTFRNRKIRIIGAGFWRKEERIYEKQKNT